MSPPWRDTWVGAILPVSDSPVYCESFPLPLRFLPVALAFSLSLSYIWLILPPPAALTLLPYLLRGPDHCLRVLINRRRQPQDLCLQQAQLFPQGAPASAPLI